ncbi:hypothetical protein P8936_10675 [Edaphobacter paludis]|uniref:Pentapeptide repeat-containing protein n=1 Tax=Edaphobacter paludis TaxID=3035702 RepID=A0AAU7CU09_9BACT
MFCFVIDLRFRFCFQDFFFDDFFFHDLSLFADDGARSEITQPGMSDHSFDWHDVLVGGSFFGQAETCDLKTVEEQAGAFAVDGAGGNALKNLGDGGQNGAAVFDPR